MRLIDADKLDEDVLYWNMHDDPKQKDYDTRDIEMVLMEQPEVEAIPIEWIIDEILDGWYGISEIMFHWEEEKGWEESIWDKVERKRCERQQSTTSA